MTRARTLADLGSQSLATDAELASEVATLDSTISGLALGKVLQVVQGSRSTAFITSSTSFVDTGVSATITPSSASNKILVLVNHTGMVRQVGSSSGGISTQIVRGSSTVVAKDAVLLGYVGTNVRVDTSNSSAVLDSPNTTSATTYKTQIKTNSSSSTATICNGETHSSIILIEVSA